MFYNNTCLLVAQLAERWTVVESIYPKVAGSSPAEKIFFVITQQTTKTMTLFVLIVASIAQGVMSTSTFTSTSTSTSTFTPVTYDGSCSCCWVNFNGRQRRVYNYSIDNVEHGVVNPRTRRCTPPYRPPTTPNKYDDSDSGNRIFYIVLSALGAIVLVVICVGLFKCYVTNRLGIRNRRDQENNHVYDLRQNADTDIYNVTSV